jgi:hypothetical protein
VHEKRLNISVIREAIRRGFRPTAIGLHVEEAAKLILADAMSEKRRAIRKVGLGAGNNPAHNVAVGRHAKDKARSLKKRLMGHNRKPLDKAVLMRDRIPSTILDNIDPDRPLRWKRIIARRFRTVKPRLSLKHLNFLDFPVETIRELQDIAKLESEEVSAYLDFDDTYCHDIGAYLVIAEIWPQLSNVFFGGRMPSPVQKVLDAVGLRRDLRISLNSVRNHDDIWPFELRRRRTRGTTASATAQLQPQGREQLNDRLIDTINEWLAVASESHSDGDSIWVLTGDGKANIANMVGEILDNAERHSTGDGDGDWTMAAFMARRDGPDGKPAMKCYLGFLSVGAAISEAIATAPPATKQFCHIYASQHARTGQCYDTLMTIAALQDGVTSSHAAVRGNRGGTGHQDTLAFIGELGGVPEPLADVQATIISGRSCIRLRHPILVGRPDAKGRRVQWCNAENDPIYPPDRSVAFDLPAHFAGTLVSVAFTLDPSIFVPEGDDDGQSDD